MSRRRKIFEESHTTPSGIVHTAKVFRVAEFDEWQVDFYMAGVKVRNSTYHTCNKDDATGTAKLHIEYIVGMNLR